MKNSKTWKQNEDQALITLHKERNITKWTTISKLLHQQFGFKGKTPKKCRQRFKNHLNPNINRQDWTETEEKKLLDLQNHLGNRWAQISRNLPGRTDNSVKNKFFSKYRRAVRKLNILLQKRKINGFKQIQIGFLYKLINLIDNKFKGDLNIDDQLVKQAQTLKQAIIQFQNISVEEYQLQQKELDFLVSKIQFVNSQLKRKAGKRKKPKVSINVIQDINKTQTMAKLNTDDAIDTPRKEENQNQGIYLSQMLKKPASPYYFRSIAREKQEEIMEDQENYRQSRLIIGRWGEEEEQSEIWKLPIYGNKDSEQYF